jgi:hypothetical protein
LEVDFRPADRLTRPQLLAHNFRIMTATAKRTTKTEKPLGASGGVRA